MPPRFESLGFFEGLNPHQARILAERLTREAWRLRAELLEELGIEDQAKPQDNLSLSGNGYGRREKRIVNF